MSPEIRINPELMKTSTDLMFPGIAVLLEMYGLTDFVISIALPCFLHW